MTVVENWFAPDRDADVWRINGCLQAEIHGEEVRSAEDGWFALLRERILPLIWLAMPVHDAARKVDASETRAA